MYHIISLWETLIQGLVSLVGRLRNHSFQIGHLRRFGRYAKTKQKLHNTCLAAFLLIVNVSELLLNSISKMTLETADSRNKFEDLSGVDITAYANPYDALIDACENDPVATPLSSYQVT